MSLPNHGSVGIWVLGNQLWVQQAALASVDPQDHPPVILIESASYARQRRFHRQKLILVWSAMRHFALNLRDRGFQVTYEVASDFATPLHRWIEEENISQLSILEPSDRPMRRYIDSLDLPCAIEWMGNNLFLWSPGEFKTWADGRKRLLMEDFYRQGRRRFDVLMEGDRPVGDRWNLDKENRQPPKGDLNPPAPPQFPPDEITREVIARVKALDFPTYGVAESFSWGVTRKDARAALERFIAQRLPTFGPYQDAMVAGEETLWHALLSPYLNLGLLHPLEVIEAAQSAYYRDDLPLNSVEGFIRQILGWREYMHGIYHYVSADYPDNNWFDHHHPLPAFFWDSTQTEMNCLHQTLSQVERIGYAHHIQRLMVLSNFALIVGISPQELESWFHSAFIDGYDWVMQTNVIGMGQFADGGLLASKPYASSANYINKMSDYCNGCRYHPKKRTGSEACPFNYFYWDFLDRHQERLRNQGRMNLILGNLKRLDESELSQMREAANTWRDRQASLSDPRV